MKLGVEQQRGAPQEVYNNPKNKFVAEFLGTPPINMFEGTVKDNKLYIGEEQILALETKVEDQEVYVGIRPEGVIVDKKGKLSAEVEQIETLGRDISIIAKNPNTQKPTFKAIIDADIKVSVGAVKFSVKPNKCFVFSKETEERLA